VFYVFFLYLCNVGGSDLNYYNIDLVCIPPTLLFYIVRGPLRNFIRRQFTIVIIAYIIVSKRVRYRDRLFRYKFTIGHPPIILIYIYTDRDVFLSISSVSVIRRVHIPIIIEYTYITTMSSVFSGYYVHNRHRH